MKIVQSQDPNNTNRSVDYDTTVFGTVAINHHLKHSNSMLFSVSVGGVFLDVGNSECFVRLSEFMKGLLDPFKRQRLNSYYVGDLAFTVRFYSSLSDELGGKYVIKHASASWRATSSDIEQSLNDIDKLIENIGHFEALHKEMLAKDSSISHDVFISTKVDQSIDQP